MRMNDESRISSLTINIRTKKRSGNVIRYLTKNAFTYNDTMELRIYFGFCETSLYSSSARVFRVCARRDSLSNRNAACFFVVSSVFVISLEIMSFWRAPFQVLQSAGSLWQKVVFYCLIAQRPDSSCKRESNGLFNKLALEISRP